MLSWPVTAKQDSKPVLEVEGLVKLEELRAHRAVARYLFSSKYHNWLCKFGGMRITEMFSIVILQSRCGRSLRGCGGIDQVVLVLQGHQIILCFCQKIPGSGGKPIQFIVKPEGQVVHIQYPPSCEKFPGVGRFCPPTNCLPLECETQIMLELEVLPRTEFFLLLLL